MASVRLTSAAFADLERIFEFHASSDPRRASAAIASIRAAVEILGEHLLIGRVADEGRRELVISRGKSAYVALYRWRPDLDAVLILRVRAAREAGFHED